MNVLVGCEFSGVVSDAFRARGHYVLSADYLPSESKSPCHFQDDVRKLLYCGDFDLALFFPPCTYLCVSGLHWNRRVEGREKLTEQALDFVRELMAAPIPRIALENPVGCISTRIKPPNQIIQPYEFGENASKATCLWLKNLPLLKPTRYYPPSTIRIDRKIYKRWGNETASGQNNVAPGPDRWKERSRTYKGVALAMAAQWGYETRVSTTGTQQCLFHNTSI